MKRLVLVILFLIYSVSAFACLWDGRMEEKTVINKIIDKILEDNNESAEVPVKIAKTVVLSFEEFSGKQGMCTIYYYETELRLTSLEKDEVCVQDVFATLRLGTVNYEIPAKPECKPVKKK